MGALGEPPKIRQKCHRDFEISFFEGRKKEENTPWVP